MLRIARVSTSSTRYRPKSARFREQQRHRFGLHNTNAQSREKTSDERQIRKQITTDCTHYSNLYP